MPSTTIENLRNAIAARDGGKLAAGFAVRKSNKKLSKRKQQEILVNRNKKVEAIYQYVNAQKKVGMKPEVYCAKYC